MTRKTYLCIAEIKGRGLKLSPLQKKMGGLIIWDMEKSEYVTTFLSWSSPASAPVTASKSQKTKGGKENEKLPTVGNDQIQDHLRNLNVL